MKLSTGVVRANAYAPKIRDVFFAMTQGKLEPSKTNEAASEINQHLLNIFQEEEIDKKDAVRIQFNFDIVDGEKISVDWSSAEIEVYKKDRVITDLKAPE